MEAMSRFFGIDHYFHVYADGIDIDTMDGEGILEESLLEDAKESFVLCAVMEDTGFTVEKNAFESALETRALEYGYDDVEQFTEAYGGKADLLLSYAKDSLLGRLAKTT